MYTFGDIAWKRGRIFTKFLYFFMNLKSLSFLQFNIDSNENTTLHTFNTCCILLQIDNNIPMYTFGDIAWKRGRTFTKFLSFFMNLEKSVIFTNFHRFEGKHNIAHLLLMFYPCVQSKHFPLRTFGDMAWTRGRILKLS